MGAKLKISYRDDGNGGYEKSYVVKFPCVRFTNQEAGKAVHLSDTVEVNYEIKSVDFSTITQSIQISGVPAMWSDDGNSHLSYLGSCDNAPAAEECKFGGADSSLSKTNVMEWMEFLASCDASGDDWERTVTVCREYTREDGTVFSESQNVKFTVTKIGQATGLISVQNVAAVDLSVSIDSLGLDSCPNDQYKHAMTIDVGIDKGDGFVDHALNVNTLVFNEASFDNLFTASYDADANLLLSSQCQDVNNCDADTTSLLANGQSVSQSFVVHYEDSQNNRYASSITINTVLDQCPLQQEPQELDLANAHVTINECDNNGCVAVEGNAEIETDSYIKAVFLFLNDADWAKGVTVTSVKLWEDCFDLTTADCVSSKSCNDLASTPGYQFNSDDVCNDGEDGDPNPAKTVVTLATDNLIGTKSVIEFEFELNEYTHQRRRLLRATIDHVTGGIVVKPASMEVSDKMEGDSAEPLDTNNVWAYVVIGILGALVMGLLVMGAIRRDHGSSGYKKVAEGRFKSNIAF